MLKKYYQQKQLSSIEVLTTQDLTDSYISYEEFILIKAVLKEYDDLDIEI